MQVLPSCGAAERGASVFHTVGPKLGRRTWRGRDGCGRLPRWLLSTPTLDEVLAPRLARMATMRRVVDALTEAEHHRYTVRDLAEPEAGGCTDAHPAGNDFQPPRELLLPPRELPSQPVCRCGFHGPGQELRVAVGVGF